MSGDEFSFIALRVMVYNPGPPAEETDTVMFYVVEEVWEVFLPVVGR